MNGIIILSIGLGVGFLIGFAVALFLKAIE